MTNGARSAILNANVTKDEIKISIAALHHRSPAVEQPNRQSIWAPKRRIARRCYIFGEWIAQGIRLSDD